VAIGGGHGLASSLRAVRSLSDEVTAVVSVADDGGSSGRLRESLGLPALGDLRKAIVALASPTSSLATAMRHRFNSGELDGHALGNLLIAAMVETQGDLIRSLDEVTALVGGTGRVLPAALEPVVLCGLTTGGDVIRGQVAVMGTPDIDTVQLDPVDVNVPDEVVNAIEAADLVVVGPGSVFTSVLAACATKAVTDALAATNGTVAYVCNLRPQVPETLGLDAAGHVAALRRHGIEPDAVLVDPAGLPAGPPVEGVRLARLGSDHHSGHDTTRLAAALAELL
jgi:uncharacterized cofD-like protein